jgi:L-aspartate oxidase
VRGEKREVNAKWAGPVPVALEPTAHEGAPILVIGSGIAGLTFALKVAEEAPVLVVTKKSRADSNTNWARGGIAAGLGPDDDPELHLADTLSAGDGLCHRDRVELLVREGPDRVRELVEWGVRFHRENGDLSLGREGGHSRRRIVRAGDRTGREIERALLAAVEAHPRIQVVQHLLVVDLLVGPGVNGGRRCRGVVALDEQRGVRVRIPAPLVFLATGGGGQVYRHTTNPTIATGDGVAMAYRAGAQVANLEFVQFHPTALYPTEDPAFLISEALRGEGAVLRRLDGSLLMEGADPWGSLASRDVVARAIHHELQRSGDTHVLLDVSTMTPAIMEARFPGAMAGCRAQGINPFNGGIPVVPAAHYLCGGVVTDEDGRTNLQGLLAAGEAAHTGVHGANRLASNSLLEAVVFSNRAARAVLTDPERTQARTEPGVSFSPVQVPQEPVNRAEQVRVAHVRSRLRSIMWEDVGIVRSDEGLERAARRVKELTEVEEGRWPHLPWSVEGVELRNLLQLSHLIVTSARLRKESRGLHFNVDHPERDQGRFSEDTFLEPAPHSLSAF